MTAFVAIVCAALAAALTAGRRQGQPPVAQAAVCTPPVWSRHRRLVASGAGFLAVLVLAPWAVAVVAAPLAAGGLWWWIGRLEPRASRRRRERLQRDLPLVVDLMGAALAAGAAPGVAARVVGDAVEGPAGECLVAVAQRLRLGDDPVRAWRRLAEEEGLQPLGRAMARAADSGASVATVIDALAEDLSQQAWADADHAARSLGVRATIPVGVCLLPAFVLLGVVPMVVGVASQLAFLP